MKAEKSVGKEPTYEELERRVRELEEQLAERKRVEGALLRTRRRLNTVFDFVPYPLAVLSLDQKVRYLNSGFIHLFGWTSGEMEGKRIPFVPADLTQEAEEDIKRDTESTEDFDFCPSGDGDGQKGNAFRQRNAASA